MSGPSPSTPAESNASVDPGLPVRPIYLDYNATTPVDPRVLDALLPALRRDFGNPSSTHAFGEAPRRMLATARASVAALIGAGAGEIVFTGSGSEADALAIRGAVLAAASHGHARTSSPRSPNTKRFWTPPSTWKRRVSRSLSCRWTGPAV